MNEYTCDCNNLDRMFDKLFRAAMNHIDLFAGIGGFALGFEQAGIETLAHVEIDKNCQNVLRTHWDNLILSDVCEAGAHNLPHADIVTFGSPCQDLSIAGKRKGMADGTRSSLFFEAVRIIRETNPRYAVWENVPGALSSNTGFDFKSVLEALLESDVPMPRSGRWASAGMVRSGEKEVAWRILDAQYFGVAQRRRRLFLIFCSGNGSPSSILFEREGMCWDPPARGKTGEGITSGVAPSLTASNDPSRSPQSGEVTRQVAAVFQACGDRDNPSISIGNDVAFTIPANPMSDMGQAVAYNISSFNSNSMKSDNPHSGIQKVDTSRTIDNSGGNPACNQGGIMVLTAYENHPADSRITETGDISQQLTSRMGTGGGNVPLISHTVGALQTRDHKGIGTTIDDKIVAFQRSQFRLSDKLENQDVAPTLKSQTKSGDTEMNISQGVGVRRLTPTECERLQGFPDGWTAGQSDSARYKQLGNAVAVPVIKWLGQRIKEDYNESNVD